MDANGRRGGTAPGPAGARLKFGWTAMLSPCAPMYAAETTLPMNSLSTDTLNCCTRFDLKSEATAISEPERLTRSLLVVSGGKPSLSFTLGTRPDDAVLVRGP